MADYEKFVVGKDASGAPTYTYNNQPMSKEEFDKQKNQSDADQQTMMNAKTPGIDDDQDMIAMQERAKAAMAARKPVKKASGGSIKSSASKRADGIAQRGKTKGRFV